eukprot:GILJ01031023.1.p1 GENE.GILJ01031023.1~~GILJ01031023.1.p1  ORF type:complete len:243 (+),score=19.13 GILJ01031023.1:503-1231(+)
MVRSVDGSSSQSVVSLGGVKNERAKGFREPSPQVDMSGVAELMRNMSAGSETLLFQSNATFVDTHNKNWQAAFGDYSVTARQLPRMCVPAARRSDLIQLLAILSVMYSCEELQSPDKNGWIKHVAREQRDTLWYADSLAALVDPDCTVMTVLLLLLKGHKLQRFAQFALIAGKTPGALSNQDFETLVNGGQGSIQIEGKNFKLKPGGAKPPGGGNNNNSKAPPAPSAGGKSQSQASPRQGNW